jgi:hypothetical protein
MTPPQPAPLTAHAAAPTTPVLAPAQSAPPAAAGRLGALLAGWWWSPVIIFLATRVLLFWLAYLSDLMFASDAGSAYFRLEPDRLWLDVWLRWDSAWYLGIARNGYEFFGNAGSVAFFPVYPLAIRSIGGLLGDVTLGAWIVSNVATLGAFLVLYKLVQEMGGDRGTAARSTLYLAVYPTAFFLIAVYTESTFLFLAVSAFYCAHRRIWPGAALFAMLASATRIVGVVLLGMIVLEWAAAQGWTISRAIQPRTAGETWRALGRGLRSDWTSLLWLALVPLGIASYMFFLATEFNAPLAFQQAMAGWDRHGPNLVTTFTKDFAPFFSQSFGDGVTNWKPMVEIPLLVFSLLMLIPVGLKLGAPSFVYMAASLLIPLSTSPISIGRYSLVCFPMFIVLGMWGRRRWVEQTILVTFCTLLALYLAGFTNWLFVG